MQSKKLRSIPKGKIYMETLDPYIKESSENTGWKRVVGGILSFIGFVLLAHAFIVLAPFGQLLSTWGEAAFAVVGGIIGVVGLKMIGKQMDDLAQSFALVVAGAIATVVVSFVSSRFGFLGIIILGAFMLWWENRSNSKVED